jgi:hypothetical protein
MVAASTGEPSARCRRHARGRWATLALVIVLPIDLELSNENQRQPPPPAPQVASVSPASPGCAAWARLGNLVRALDAASRQPDHRRVISLARQLGAALDRARAEALYEAARRHALLGEPGAARDCLAAAVLAGYADPQRVQRDPAFRNLRSDPVFRELLTRLKAAAPPIPPDGAISS